MEEKILLVEDDNNISDMIDEYMSDLGYKIDIAENGVNALSLVGKNKYSLLLIDLMLPDLSGFSIIKKVRENSTVPIIIVTAKNSEVDKMRGFEVGADDYVEKPFSLIELVARIKANIRRANLYSGPSDEEEELRCGNLVIKLAERRILIDEKVINLTKKEYDIIYELALNANRAVSKEELYEKVWKQPYYGDDNVINSHINRLRAKLDKNGARDVIQTLWGVGYRMEI
ncbi:MAG: response regulator transcription factor [Pseudobutyrivibrio sp.]|nr:response regulator transcription factor [Pseudobutyrivibrio sp.]